MLFPANYLLYNKLERSRIYYIRLYHKFNIVDNTDIVNSFLKYKALPIIEIILINLEVLVK